MAPVPMDPIFVSFHDDNAMMTPLCLVDGRPDTFLLTTGGFPQDIILSVGTSAFSDISSLRLELHEAKRIVVEKCTTALPTVFEKVADLTLPRTPEDVRQVEELQFDLQSTGKGVRYFRLRLLSGYNQFVGLFGVTADGEESQQRVAILESQPEVVM
ncbi:Placental protein 25 (PP25) [Trypanosoma rangeli]|uniref:Placental protein 25 (PP25) n=1 Tax=Trypanosoma rangeli TaxID=5698 RepID=A0A3S5ISF4_TRYRA|nr:Placental protein 25 (PP25) [Trypanosoma rangeli]RNF10910.1 Placental protein 25 (PP25) [Trypanosoma rangeli]|eukprot:RNF10910.1 Placental protein 25 (PP25) [Trypanosoma rangeli]